VSGVQDGARVDEVYKPALSRHKMKSSKQLISKQVSLKEGDVQLVAVRHSIRGVADHAILKDYTGSGSATSGSNGAIAAMDF